MAVNPPEAGADLFEGVYLLRALINTIVFHGLAGSHPEFS
jgi:hypothetical protein